MIIIDTRKMSRTGEELNSDQAYWVYNGLDCCVTEEVRQKISSYMDEVSTATYEQTIKMQAPILDMMLRGILVDTDNRASVIEELEKRFASLDKNWTRLCVEGIGLPKAVNPGSPTQVSNLLYNTLSIPGVKTRNAKGIYTLSTGRTTLEELRKYFYAEPIVNYILAMRDCKKALGFLRTKLDSDHRMRTSLSLVGTQTGRLSSSFSDMGTGTNLQNIDRALRRIFVADPGKILVNVDLPQGDSRNLGALCWNLFHESHGEKFAGAYLDACESADLHTFVCRMAWPDLPWTDDLAANRKIAEVKLYRLDSYRDLGKKLGHGSNYRGKPPTMAKHSRIPVRHAQNFQKNYFKAFPAIPAYHEWVEARLRQFGHITHLFGRRRYFFKKFSEQVLNSAVAYSPQSMTAEQINRGMLQLWPDERFEFLIQVHDSLLFQVDENLVNELVPVALKRMKVILPLVAGREFSPTLDAETGWNWAKQGDSRKEGYNHFGLAAWTGEEKREAPRRSSRRPLSLLEYV